MTAKGDFDRTVDEAVRDLAEHGFDSAERLAYWEERIRRAAEGVGAASKMDEMLRDVLRASYERMLGAKPLAKAHEGVERWTIERVKPELRAELDRRILASANLIRLRKEERVRDTLARFSGWASSIPKGGSGESDARDARRRIKKPIASAPFEERRVLIDQGHKLFSSLNEIVATGGGAIAGVWRSRWRQPGYDYRPDHKDRDEKVFLLRDSWAIAEGLVAKRGVAFLDEVTRPGEEPFCRCSYQYVYSLRALYRIAPDLITKKGEAALEAAREKMGATA